MKNQILMVGILLLTSCAGAPMLPSDQRRVEFVDETSVDKGEAYNRALTYLAKNLGDSNKAIRLKEPETGHIVTEMNVSCKDMGFGSLDTNDYRIQFTLDFQAKDKRVRTEFSNMTTLVGGLPREGVMSQITNQGNLDKAKKCVEPLRGEIVRSLASSSKAKDW